MKFSNMKKFYLLLGILIFIVISISISISITKKYDYKDVKSSTLVKFENLDNSKSTLEERYKISINETIEPGQTFTIYPSEDAFIPYNNLGYLIYDLSWKPGLSLTINQMYDWRNSFSTYSEGKLYFNDNLGKELSVSGGYVNKIAFTNNNKEPLKLEGTILLQSMKS